MDSCRGGDKPLYGLVQERRNSSAQAMELRLSCISLSVYWRMYASHGLHVLTDLFLYYKSRYNMNFFNMVADGSDEVEAMQKFLEENLKKARDGGYKVREPWPSEHATTELKLGRHRSSAFGSMHPFHKLLNEPRHYPNFKNIQFAVFLFPKI